MDPIFVTISSPCPGCGSAHGVMRQNELHEGGRCAGRGCQRLPPICGDSELTVGEPVFVCNKCERKLCATCTHIHPHTLHSLVYGRADVVGRSCTLLEDFYIEDETIIFKGVPATNRARILAADIGTLLVRLEDSLATAWLLDKWREKVALDDELAAPKSDTSAWEITIFAQGHVAFYPVCPRVPPHKEGEWGADWFQDVLEKLRSDPRCEEALKVMEEAYWHSDYDVGHHRPLRPLRAVCHLFAMATKPPRSIRCNLLVATRVHIALLASATELTIGSGRSYAVSDELAARPSYDEPHPWDIARVVYMAGPANTPSVLDLLTLVEHEKLVWQDTVDAFHAGLPNEAAEEIAWMSAPQWRPAVSGGVAYPPEDERIITSTVADLEACEVLIAQAYACCIARAAGTGSVNGMAFDLRPRLGF